MGEAQISGGEAVARALARHGIDTLFGLPGYQLDDLFCALYDHRETIRVINARHEQGAAYMALGYAQATGRAGVYAVVPGPGFLNTTAALATAYACGAPVLALIGQIDAAGIGAGGGDFHEIPDQSGILSRLARWSALARQRGEVEPLIEEAFARLAAGPGPVAVELPMDVLRARAPAGDPVPPAPSPRQPGEDAICAAAHLLAKARAPLIFAGGGAIGAAAELRRVAEFVQAPVVSHLQGRGILDTRDPLSIGLLEGSRLWPDADVILAVGTRFYLPRKAWRLRPGQRVIRVDLDEAQFSRGLSPDIALGGDAGLVLARLLIELEQRSAKAPSRSDDFIALKRWARSQFERALAPQMAFVDALRAALPGESILVADYTQVAYAATAAFDVYRPRTLLTPGYQGTLGFGFATALGAKVAQPSRPVVALVGDGGFLFTAAELATAVLHDIRTVTIVFNDGAYGNVKRMQEVDYGGKVIASDLHNPDFVKFAESFGAAARRVHSAGELGHALRWAMAEPKPVVIEVPVGPMPDPWPLLEPQG